ncbi:MAG: HEAT repeat domain-containing protein [Planctomycetota bacterium]
MRTLAVCLLLASVAAADPVEAVPDSDAKTALAEFDSAYRKAKLIEQKQELIYNLHDVPHPKVLSKCMKLLRHKDPAIRNVAALAIGGQGFDKKKAGGALMKQLPKDKKTVEVATSIIEAMAELKYYGYWPELEKYTGKESRSAVVIRILDLLGSNKDYRAIPMLLKMYKVAMPKRVTWQTGTVNVDTGAAGNEDNEAAEREFNARYGRGGSKEKAKAQGKAKSFDARNFTTQIRKCAKAITGEDIKYDMELEDWWIANWEMVARKSAQLNHKNSDKAAAKAAKELPAFKAKVEEERKKLEEELAKQEEKEKEKEKEK